MYRDAFITPMAAVAGSVAEAVLDTLPQADAAATMIAIAIHWDHPAIERVPANALRDETDLGERRVTVGVWQATS